MGGIVVRELLSYISRRDGLLLALCVGLGLLACRWGYVL
jgi:hypothetical protein